MKQYLPEISTIQRSGVFIGRYRRMDGGDWHHVRQNGTDRTFKTEAAAREAARDVLLKLLNPPIRKSEAPAGGDDLAMQAQEARLKKQADEWRRMFGCANVKGQSVKVEKKRAKRAQNRA